MPINKLNNRWMLVLCLGLVIIVFGLSACGGGGGDSSSAVFIQIPTVTPSIVQGTWVGNTNDGVKLTVTFVVNGSNVSGQVTARFSNGEIEEGTMNGTLQGADVLFGTAIGGGCTYNYTSQIYANSDKTQYIMRGNYTGNCDNGTFELTKQ